MNILKTEKSNLTIYSFENKDLINLCIQDIQDKLIVNPSIIVYGKNCIQHRSIGFFSDESVGYFYSGKLAKSQKLTPNLKKLLIQVSYMFNTKFNGILVNKYDSGLDYIGKHSDDESNLSNVGVVSISYGASRKFRIRDKKTNKKILDVITKSHELLHMGGDFQKEFTHEIPIEKKFKDSRISFTFRYHKK